MKTVYSFILLLACSTLTFGSWFETNGLAYQYFSIINVDLYNKNVPFMSLSFGLWNQCVWNNSFVTCSPVRINYNLGRIYFNVPILCIHISFR